jgi:hypothetical protein
MVQVGNDPIFNYKHLNQSLSSDTNWKSIATGITQLLKTDGIWTWGDNEAGQIGNGSLTDQLKSHNLAPILVGHYAGAYFNLANKSDGTVWRAVIHLVQLADGSRKHNTYPYKNNHHRYYIYKSR